MTVDLIVLAARLHGASGGAVAVQGGRIVAIGDRRDARAWTGPSTRVLDLGDATVLPGLTDAHSHPMLGASVARGLDLRGADSLDDVRAAVAAGRARLGRGDWLIGWGLDHNVWDGREVSAAAFEAASGDVPTFLRMFDAHSAVVNRAALERAAVRGGRRFDTGSEIVVDASGTPTGLLLESEALAVVERVVPPDSRADLRRRLASSLRAMAASGLTGAHVLDFEDDPADLYRALDDSGELPLRLKIHPWVSPSSGPEDWDALCAQIGEGGRLWRMHGVKLFLDGTIDNGTAWLRSPDSHGLSVRSTWDDPERYRSAIAHFGAAGVGTATHAIGDRAVMYAAESIRLALRRHLGARHRIEHLELTGDDIVNAVADSGAIASMQPTHCTRFITDAGTDNWSGRVGARRARHAWRTRSLVDAGTTLALGSDWPIAPFEPLRIMADARLRRRVERPDLPPILRAEGLTAAQAIDGYTMAAAIAAGVEHEEGAIRPGTLADLTVLAGDPIAVSPEEFAELPVLATIVGGEVRHSL
ncbi:amidohydrolase [Agromyces albus]|uniref:amidohydrolase n=1 Tax=Agromyces albus TaxID=205332 RepID=UPI00277E53B0|nr:amidohydrolase [Agromyces albus]MDQ0574621.1 putative amidohydrolase YtcJ [Agromyces albus]